MIDDEHDIMYIKCKYQEDIASIMSLAKNLPRGGDEDRPTIITHIPSSFYDRYQACEKILWGICNQDKGKYQTNLRLGRMDLLLRYKKKLTKHHGATYLHSKSLKMSLNPTLNCTKTK